MRNFIDIVARQALMEADEPTSKTKTAAKTKFDLFPDLEAGSRDIARAAHAGHAPAPLGKKAGRGKTRRAASSGVGRASHPGAGEAMARMMAHAGEDEMSDAEAARHAGLDHDQEDDTAAIADTGRPRHLAIGQDRPTPTNDNLPALVNRDLMAAGDTRIQPEWHQVKHLPGYMLNAIRAGGRAVFRQFTDTPLEEIQMICTIPGMNTEHEVKAVMNWVRQNGVPEDQAEMEFGGGVKADVRLWKTEDFSFLLVKDYMGIYVYAWAGGRGVHVGADKRKMIGR